MDQHITELLRKALAENRRPPDGKLHPSSDLIGSLRHSQLRAAGAPTVESELVSDVRLWTGTSWHSFFEHSVFRGLPGMFEVRLDSWLPDGWSGTADWLLWDSDYRAFKLRDLKTMKGEGIKWVMGEMKEEHLWQLSAYWYACANMGIPLVKDIGVFYLPMNVPTDNPNVEPVLVEAVPLPRSTVIETMEFRWSMTNEYLKLVDEVRPENYKGKLARNYIRDPEHSHLIYLNKALADVQERVQGVVYDSKKNIYDVKLMPHWSARYCPYPDELCDCSTQGTEKIGHYYYDFAKGSIFYLPRKGYQHIVQTVKLTPTQEDKLRGNDGK